MRVLWASEFDGETLPYDASVHRMRAWNFCYWNDGDTDAEILIIGDGAYGDHPLAGSHHALVDYARAHGCTPPHTSPVGAGSCTDGRIRGWSSKGFGVTTPELLRSHIAVALGMK